MKIQKVAALMLLVGSLWAAPVQWKAADGGNDNWYEYVSAPSIFAPVDFNSARTAALGSTFMGMQGYLATITSAAEQTFVLQFPPLLGFGGGSSTFLGASDEAEEGTFRWLNGPEAGQALSYTDWAPGRPSDAGDFLVMSYSFTYIGWTDSSGGAFGYLVEYGDGIRDSTGGPGGEIPEPGTWTLMVPAAVWLVYRKRRR